MLILKSTDFIRHTARAEEGTKAIPSSDSIPAYRPPRTFLCLGTRVPAIGARKPSGSTSDLAGPPRLDGRVRPGQARGPVPLYWVPGLMPTVRKRRINFLHVDPAVQPSGLFCSHSFHGEVFSSVRL